MRITHIAGVLWIVGAAVAIPSCMVLAPCDNDTRSLAGAWTLSTVNGQAIPAGGYPLPSGTDRLTAGTLHFSPTYSQCSGIGEEGVEGYEISYMDSETGTALAEWTLVTAGGAPKPLESYAGRFSHTVSTRAVSVSANGQAAPGQRSADAGTITFSGTLPSLGGLTAVFRRAQ